MCELPDPECALPSPHGPSSVCSRESDDRHVLLLLLLIAKAATTTAARERLLLD